MDIDQAQWLEFCEVLYGESEKKVRVAKAHLPMSELREARAELIKKHRVVLMRPSVVKRPAGRASTP